ncbi:MAG: DUF5017 domain-containing protein [Bacteroidales bacterium]|mgnify:CR=1 FL=1|nr:DUF5017 domain-containing protein [Bacteroidales bacterium]
MKRTLPFLKLSLAFVFSVSFALPGNGQALMVENFDYPSGALLTASGWTAHSGGGSQAIDVVVPGLTFAGYPLSNIGGMAQLDNTGEDVNKTFTPVTSGAVYAAFMMKVDAVVDGYFLHFGPAAMGSTYFARLYTKPGTGSNFKFALGKSNESTPVVSTAEFATGTTFLAVLKYEIVDGATNDLMSFYLIDGTVPATEPATATIPAFTTTAADNNPGSIGLRQFNAAQRIYVDGIRVATSWAEAVTAPLGGDTFAPVFAAGFPTLSAVNATGATLEVSLDEPGKAFYMVVPNDATAPTADQVIAGAAYGAVTPAVAGSIDVTAAGSSFTAALTGLTTNTDFDIYVVAQDDEASPNKQAEPVKLELFTEKQPDILYSADFETSLLPFSQVSITGEQEWKKATYNNNSYAYMNGYASGNKENEDWLITPALNLDTATNVKVSFKTAKNYTGPAIKVMISSNFNGTFTAAGITGATWTDITSSFEFSSGSYNWKASGEYALSAYSGKVYIAFVYTSTTEGAAGWEVDDFLVTGYVKSTGIDQPATAGLKLYPVPARNELIIDNALNISRTEVYDLAGRLRLSSVNTGESRIRLAVGHLSPGIYLVRFATNEGPKVEKFVKE